MSSPMKQIRIFPLMTNRLVRLPLDDTAKQKKLSIHQYNAHQNEYDHNIVINLYNKKVSHDPLTTCTGITLQRETP